MSSFVLLCGFWVGPWVRFLTNTLVNYSGDVCSTLETNGTIQNQRYIQRHTHLTYRSDYNNRVSDVIPFMLVVGRTSVRQDLT